ncbi:hypothetical protein CUJ83_10335 [Methanocella sp. CWC-04]|uniref:HTH asnC-type domain-containing protein n=1 Tax=Methanooceanicella nereidis TaxID=2052831 RepID=A0AAP2W5E2_9EURY|nr:hypothetical protein [Methanocella sp. CWC-04]
MDEQDFKILRLLCRDSRISYEKIGSELGIAPEVAINRIFRMRDVGVISEYRLNVNPLMFGFRTAIINAEAYRPSCKQKDIRALRRMDRVSTMMECAGRYYSVSILYGDEKDLRAQVDAVRAKISPSKVLSVLRPREPSISSLNLTGQDWRIIEYLLDDPRASEDKMSRDMGINVRTIQRRLERMITGGIVCSTVVVQPRLFEGLISYRFNILFNGAGKDAYADVIPSLNNYWYSLRLDSPEGVIVDLYRESISGIEEDIAIVKGISSVKDVTYTVPTRVITNDVLIRRKVIEAVFNKENV